MGATRQKSEAFSFLPVHQPGAAIRRILEEGPAVADYPVLNNWLKVLHGAVLTASVSETELGALRESLGAALSVQTLQGFAWQKPHGYCGDFEMIDRIYREHRASDPVLARWDAFFHAQAAVKAVRNRKAYFHTVVASNAARRYSAFENRILQSKPAVLRVLSVGSGPARELLEWCVEPRQWPVSFDGIESDAQAIDYARRLCRNHLDRIAFRCANPLRFTTTKRYDVCWSGGLFECLSDDLFVKQLRRLLGLVHVGGEVVVGNFGADNPTRPYMELFGGWKLWHRDAKQLRQLAARAGVESGAIRIGGEPEGVSLFLHVRKA